MKLIGKLLVGSRQMLSSLREKAVAGTLVVNRSLCEHPTKVKKKQVLQWGFHGGTVLLKAGIPRGTTGREKAGKRSWVGQVAQGCALSSRT